MISGAFDKLIMVNKIKKHLRITSEIYNSCTTGANLKICFNIEEQRNAGTSGKCMYSKPIKRLSLTLMYQNCEKKKRPEESYNLDVSLII